jgi:hypothetical protein
LLPRGGAEATWERQDVGIKGLEIIRG